jgi:hypothetical protein
MTAYPIPLRKRWILGLKYIVMVHADGRVFETIGPWIRYNSSVELRVFLS